MIKSDDSAPNAVDRTGAKAPKCWTRGVNIPAIRLELLEGDTFIFPYQHLIFATLKSTGGVDDLTLIFASHKVEIHGNRLQVLLKSVQDFSVEWVGVLPPRFAKIQPDGSVAVLEIIIRSLEEASTFVNQ